jgi:hypothetical protein
MVSQRRELVGESVRVYSKQGESLQVNLRFAGIDDSEAIIELLKKQHGTNYPKKMYDPDYLRDRIELEDLQIALAVTDSDGIIGLIGTNRDNLFLGSIALIMLVIKLESRGFGLGKILPEFLLQSTDQDRYSSIYGHCMTVDVITQTNLSRLGCNLTGILLNGCIHDRMSEYARRISPALPFKEALVVTCLPRAKTEAGPLYGSAYAGYISAVYRRLGVAFTLHEGVRPPDALVSDLTVHQEEEQKYAEFFLTHTGLDFSDRIRRMLNQYSGREQTFNGFVNLNDPGCPYACGILEDLGFFFSGLQPLSGPYEYAIMHYSPFLEVPFEQLAIVSDFKESFDYIWNKYKEARNGRKD